jgi:hypothetical protein
VSLSKFKENYENGMKLRSDIYTEVANGISYKNRRRGGGVSRVTNSYYWSMGYRIKIEGGVGGYVQPMAINNYAT